MVTHELAPQPARGNFLAEPAYPNVFDLCALCLHRRFHQHLPHPSKRKSRPVILLRTLCRFQKTQVLCNQANPHSFAKIPGWGVIMIDLWMQNATAVTHLESTLAKVYQNKGL